MPPSMSFKLEANVIIATCAGIVRADDAKAGVTTFWDNPKIGEPRPSLWG